MAKYVQGTYTTAEEANAAVDSLINQGYDTSDITLVSNEATNSTLSASVHTKVYGDNYEEEESFLDKVKDAFTGDENNTSNPTSENENNALDRYTDEIHNGRIVVLVDDNPNVDRTADQSTVDPVENSVADPISASTDVAVGSTTDPGVDPTVNPAVNTTNQPAVDPLEHAPNTTANATDQTDVDASERTPDVDTTSTDSTQEKIQLQEEQVDVDTNEVQTGEVRVHKNVTEETKTVEVPVKHEEVTIEKHAVTDGKPAENAIDDNEEITIPVTEEQIEVTKRPVVTDEVVINKETKEDTKKVSETVRKEDVDIDTDGEGDIHTDGKNNDGFNNRP